MAATAVVTYGISKKEMPTEPFSPSKYQLSPENVYHTISAAVPLFEIAAFYVFIYGKDKRIMKHFSLH